MPNLLVDSYLPQVTLKTVRAMLRDVLPGCKVRIDIPLTVIQMQMVLDILAERGIPASDVTFAVNGELVQHGPSALVLKSRKTVEEITKLCDSYKMGDVFTLHDFGSRGKK